MNLSKQIFLIIIFFDLFRILFSLSYYSIQTTAGNGYILAPNDNRPATSAFLNSPYGIWGDTTGNIYVVDRGTGRLRKFTADGSNSSTILSDLINPFDVWGDTNGNIFVTVSGSSKVIKYDLMTKTLMSSYATGSNIFGLWGDTNGNIYFADDSATVIWKVTPALVKTRFLGTGSAAYGSRLFIQGSSEQIDNVRDIWGDTNGNIYVYAGQFYKINSTGFVVSVRTRASTFTNADFFWGDENNLFIGDYYSPWVIKLPVSQFTKSVTQFTYSTVAGVPYSFSSPLETRGMFGPDNIAATSSYMYQPEGIYVDSNGVLFFSDSGNSRIRKVTTDGIVSTFAGRNSKYSGDNATALNSILYQPTGIWVDSLRNIYFADSGNFRIRMINGTTSSIQTVFGNGIGGNSGDGGLARKAQFMKIYEIGGDTAGNNLYLVDNSYCIVRKVTMTTKIISRFAGTGVCSSGSSGGVAISTNINRPIGIFVSPILPSTVFISAATYIWVVKPNGNLYVLAGSATGSFVENAALTATTISPYGIKGDTSGNLYFTDTANHRLRKINYVNGNFTTIKTLVGGGVSTTDNSLGTSYQLSTPRSLFLDSMGFIYFINSGTCTVKSYSLTTNLVVNIAGTGSCATVYNSDNTFATSVALNNLYGIGGDSLGFLYFGDGFSFGSRIRKLLINYYPSGQPTNQPTSQPSRLPSGQPSSQPSRQPTRQPSSIPTNQPTGQPSSIPTQQPTMQPTSHPSRPTSQPSRQPSSQPSRQPVARPTGSPTRQPSSAPSSQPSSRPTSPSSRPTSQPSSHPSAQPTGPPSSRPSCQPTAQPSSRPSRQPYAHPTSIPSCQPFIAPSSQPSSFPTTQPSSQPTTQPSAVPTLRPSAQPTRQPVSVPTSQPTLQPTSMPTGRPSRLPTSLPSSQPTGQPSSVPSVQPSSQPTCKPVSTPSCQPTSLPTSLPTSRPSGLPSSQPSRRPTEQPTSQPTMFPSSRPSSQPTCRPSSYPTISPSSIPSSQPSSFPTMIPTSLPTTQPTSHPSNFPTSAPTSQPSSQPSSMPSSLPSTPPSGSPSAQPTSFPTINPSSGPTGQPTGFPSVQPSQKPTSQPSTQPSERPSDQPTSLPSSCPSGQPNSIPSMQPTMQPTAQPSTQPSQQPFSQPSTSPSSQPSSQPSSSPTEIPSSRPSNSPTSQPTQQPSSRPSAQPSGQPSAQPSTSPSSCPTRQPTSQPSCQPSTHPTISRFNCVGTRYFSEAEIRCLDCPPNSFSNESGLAYCICKEGYFGSGNSSYPTVCQACSAGQYSTNGSLSCSRCPAGSFSSDSASSLCNPCPLNSYNANLGQSSCNICPGGRNTATTGSISLAQCVSPIPNFTLGFISLFIVFVLFGVYIISGQFHRVSFERKQKVVLPTMEKGKQLISFLRITLIKSRENKKLAMMEIINKAINNDNNQTGNILLSLSQRIYLMWKQIRKILFFFIFIILCGSFYVFCNYIFILYQIFFTSLLMWRGMHLNFPITPILSSIQTGLFDLSNYFHFMNFPVFTYFLFPFLWIFNSLASIHFNLSTVNISCAGSQAPIELLIDCLILGLTIILIKSDYQYLFNILLPNINQSYLMNSLEQGNFFQNRYVYYCLIIMGFNALNPFQISLRYAIGYVNVATFGQNRHLAHEITPSCDMTPSAPYFDSILGYGSSIIAWWLILPTIYTLAAVLVPNPVLPEHKIFPDDMDNPFFPGKTSKKLSQKGHVLDRVDADDHVIIAVSHDDEEGLRAPTVPGAEEKEREREITKAKSEKKSPAIAKLQKELSRKILQEPIVEQQQQQALETVIHNEDVLQFDLSSAKQQVLLEKSLEKERIIPEDATIIQLQKQLSQKFHPELVSQFVQELKKLQVPPPTPAGAAVPIRAETSPALLFKEQKLRRQKSLLEQRNNKKKKGNSCHPKHFLSYFLESASSLFAVDLWLTGFVSTWIYALHLLLRHENPTAYYRHSRMNVLTLSDISHSIDEFQAKNNQNNKHKAIEKASKEFAVGSSSTSKNASSFFQRISRKSEENQQWKQQIKQQWDLEEAKGGFPKYYSLCLEVKEELHNEKRVPEPFATILAFIGMGHFMTEVGRYYWSIVLRNYHVFFLACLGIWTDTTVRAYNLLEVSKEFAVKSLSSSSSSAKNQSSRHRRSSGRSHQHLNKHQEIEDEKEERDESTTSKLITIIVSSRVILFQFLPIVAIFSISAAALASSPLFVFSPSLQATLPAFLIYNSREIAFEKELDGFLAPIDSSADLLGEEHYFLRHYSWRISIRSWMTFINDSRLCQFIYAADLLILSFLFLLYSPSLLWLIVVFFAILLPFLFAQFLLFVLFFGKSIDLRDSDLSWVYRPSQENFLEEFRSLLNKRSQRKKKAEEDKTRIDRIDNDKNHAAVIQEEDENEEEENYLRHSPHYHNKVDDESRQGVRLTKVIKQEVAGPMDLWDDLFFPGSASIDKEAAAGKDHPDREDDRSSALNDRHGNWLDRLVDEMGASEDGDDDSLSTDFHLDSSSEGENEDDLESKELEDDSEFDES